MSLFHKDNKIEVSFRKTLKAVGIPIVSFYQDKVKLNFILDTGATTSLINSTALTIIPEKEFVEGYDVVSGLDPNIEYNTKKYIIPISIKNKVFNVKFRSLNLDATFGSIEAETGFIVHGLLGSDFFEQTGCNINYENMKLCYN